MHSRVEHLCSRSSSSSLCKEGGEGTWLPAPPMSASPPPPPPHLVAPVPQALQWQALALGMEKPDQSLEQGGTSEHGLLAAAPEASRAAQHCHRPQQTDLQREVEAAVEVGRDVTVRSQSL